VRKILLLSLIVTGSCLGQVSEHPYVLYLKIGYLSEVRLPEPYLHVSVPAPIVEIKDVEGLNRQVLIMQPTIPERGATNIRIYTKSYAFNVKALINEKGSQPTQLLNLGTNIQSFEILKNLTPKNGHHNSKQSENYDTITDVIDSSLTIMSLLNVNKDLLKPNPYCYSIRKNRVIFAVDYIFYHKNKIIFKMSLYNQSKVPYGVSVLTIKYKERTGLKFINRRETKSIILQPYYEEYSTKKIDAGAVGHFIYVVDKIGTKDSGIFNFVLREEAGNRTFNIEIPSYIN